MTWGQGGDPYKNTSSCRPTLPPVVLVMMTSLQRQRLMTYWRLLFKRPGLAIT